jgi:uncharacterized protein (DUF2344 family)
MTLSEEMKDMIQRQHNYAEFFLDLIKEELVHVNEHIRVRNDPTNEKWEQEKKDYKRFKVALEIQNLSLQLERSKLEAALAEDYCHPSYFKGSIIEDHIRDFETRHDNYVKEHKCFPGPLPPHELNAHYTREESKPKKSEDPSVQNN